jgi:hypothetical protein
MERFMLLGRLAAVAAVGAASFGGAAGASTFTFNDGNAYCVPGEATGPCTDSDSDSGPVAVASGLAAGSVFGFTSPSFVDAFGKSFAARVTVVATGTPDGATGGNFTSTDITGSNYWMHLNFDFVRSFDVETRSFGRDLTVAGLREIVVDDVDSNLGVGRGSNFTDVAGVNAPIVSLGSALEEEGFIPGRTDPNGLPTTADGFNFARMQKTGDGNNDGIDDWLDAINVAANADEADKAAVRVVYDAMGLGSGFDFVWGSTSDVDHFTNKRGWNISFVVDPTPVPVPASLPLLLGSIAGVAFWRRRQRAA